MSGYEQLGVHPIQRHRHLIATRRWFSPSTLVSSTNKAEILLKVALNTITLTLTNVHMLIILDLRTM
jgi:hypothetical protein